MPPISNRKIMCSSHIVPVKFEIRIFKMKKIVKTPKTVEKIVEKVIEETSEIVESEAGLITLLGKYVFVMCLNYSYYGKLSGVNSTEIELEDSYLVYETGEWNAKTWKDAQKLPTKKSYIRLAVIEQYFETMK